MRILSRRRWALPLVAASFVVLFQELTLIRWLPGQVRALAYFPNIVLISAFLGLGIGSLRAARASLMWLWPVALVLLAATASLLHGVQFTQESSTEYLWLLYFDLPDDAPLVPSIRLPVVLFFALTALSFVAPGQYVSRRLKEFGDAGQPLRGYAADLSGSLLGVAAFAAVSFALVFPLVWFLVLLTAGVLAIHERAWHRWLSLAGAVVVLAIVSASEHADLYSPYYALSFRHEASLVGVLTNGSPHQVELPLRRADAVPVEWVRAAKTSYHLPYDKLGRQARRVLVLGAGTGNDIAVALDEGAERIDAVEIDPVILDIGEQHPDHPYSSPRVHRFNMDARAFLNRSTETYDLVVFGTLDSMTRLSALSSVRLDNFVYTADCMKAVQRHLTPDGGVALYFMIHNSFIDEHIAAMLGEAFGEEPAVLRPDGGMFNRLFLAGPAFDKVSTGERRKLDQLDTANAPTDDWPYLYLERRGMTGFYLSLVAILLGLATAAVFAASRELRASLRDGGFDAEMFLFGLAFLLLETKLVTEMNLVWGATWITSAVVFGAILLMVLAGTVLTSLRQVPWLVSATGLVISLVITCFAPVGAIAGASLAVRLGASLAFAGLPVFFAALCFAVLFGSRRQADVAFGWNMLGAVAGGFLELSSMAIGVKATTLLALAAYLAAMVVRQRRGNAATTV